MNLQRLTTHVSRVLLAFPLLLALSLVPAPPAHAASFTVNSTADAVDANPGDGLCATAAGDCTLRAAIQETNTLAGADTIWVPAGSYVLTIPGQFEDQAATGDLDIRDSLTLRGANQRRVIIDANRNVTDERAIHILGAVTVRISNLTVTGGSSRGGGGGISNGGTLTLMRATISGNGGFGGDGGGIDNTGTLTINNSTISRNRNEDPFFEGGGINNDGGTLTISQSTISNNFASTTGGGILNGGEGSMTIADSRISNNEADIGGGGLIIRSGTVVISDSSLFGNVAGAGGAIDNGNSADLTILRSTISNNVAGGGGGITNDGILVLVDSTLSGNSSGSGVGGGMFNDANLSVFSSTIANNRARRGGGIFNEASAVIDLANTILATNSATATGPDCVGTISSAGYNLVGSNAGCTFNATTGDLVGTPEDPIDPLLGPLQNNGGLTFTHALLEGSPAIDAGNPGECPQVDQRGFPRPVDGDGNGSAICDIGAYEKQAP